MFLVCIPGCVEHDNGVLKCVDFGIKVCISEMVNELGPIMTGPLILCTGSWRRMPRHGIVRILQKLNQFRARPSSLVGFDWLFVVVLEVFERWESCDVIQAADRPFQGAVHGGEFDFGVVGKMSGSQGHLRLGFLTMATPKTEAIFFYLQLVAKFEGQTYQGA